MLVVLLMQVSGVTNTLKKDMYPSPVEALWSARWCPGGPDS